MTAAKLVLVIAAALTVGACAAHDSYWARRINDLPRWQQVKCRFALVDNDAGNIKAFCPRGIPSP